MQNKSAIWVFTILLVIACLYQISFSFFTSGAEEAANAYAQGKIEEYVLTNKLDSVAGNLKDSLENEYVSDYENEHAGDAIWLGFTYQECKDREMKLGLDLQGGMNVTLEVSLPDLVKNFADDSKDPNFVKSLRAAQEMQKSATDDFITLFERAWNQEAPGVKMTTVFHNRTYIDKFPAKATNDEVVATLREEATKAVDGTEKIIRTRIDKFGVTQPTIRREDLSDRISIELPGIKDPKRMRDILQTSAKLEFWETYDNTEVFQSLGSIDSFWSATLYPDFELEGNDDLLQDLASDSTAADQDTINVAGNLDPPTNDPNDSITADAPDTTSASGDVDELLGEGNESVDDLLGGGDGTDSLSGDSAISAQTALSDEDAMKRNPLLHQNMFNLAIYNSEAGLTPENGCRLGACKLSDTAEVKRMLFDQRVQKFFPNNGRFLRLLWAAKPVFDEGTQTNYLSLYAIKIPNKDGGKARITGDDIDDARQDFDQITGGVEVILGMKPSGAEEWKEMTGANVGKAVVIALDNGVYSAPIVQGEISGGTTSISMGSTGNEAITEAKDLANILKAGSLPAPAKIVDEAVVGPTLGKENVESGMYSFIIALCVVLAYMIFYYAKAGLISNVALIANIFFLVGTLASMQASLTLPGIAGIVLTIGMSVDANVLIYERIREEIRAGKGIRLAITDGYKRAYAAIIDANLTTLLTGIVLFIFGSGPIKGFATTLIIGIFTSLFSAIFITRLIFVWQLEKKKKISFSTRMTENWMTKVNIGWIKKRKIYYVISGLIVAGGIFSLTTRSLNFGVDFTGGRTYKIEFAGNHNVDVPALDKALSSEFVEANGVEASTEVKTIKNEWTIKVTTNYLLADQSIKTDSVVEAALMTGIGNYKADSGVKIVESRSVRPTISDDIRVSAMWAIVFSLLIIFLYILARFRKWQFGLGALIAMTHDVMVVLAVFSIFYGIMPFSMEVDQAFIAAILTVVGYSINDTVVVFDRIREYLGLYKKRDSKEVVNDALNSTLSRTLNTSLSTFMVLLMIFLLGGESIRGFIFALMIGVVVGTYSSLCIATPTAVDFSKTLARKSDSEKES